MYNEGLDVELENRKFINKYKIEDLLYTNFQNLINENVFIEAEPNDSTIIFKSQPEFKNSSEIENSNVFDTEIIYDFKNYKINPEIITEIFVSAKYFIEEFEFSYDWEIIEIENNLISRISKEEKIRYLETTHRDLFLEIVKEPHYLIFTADREFNGFSDWKELTSELLYDVLIIQKYLTNWIDYEINNIPENIYNGWKKYHRINFLSNYCKEILLEIQSIKPSTKNIDLSFQISLLEEILNMRNWNEVSATKKGEILTALLGKNKDNIKKIYLEFEKKQSTISEKYSNDRNKAIKFIKTIQGNG